MKKIISVILSAAIMLSSGISAFAKLPDALTKLYTNYTCNQTVTLSLKNADDFVALLDEMEYSGILEKYIDMEMLIKSLFTNNSQMNIQTDISDNFDKILVGMTADTTQTLDLNPNFKMNATSKEGMWVEMEISDDEPVFKIIYQQPYMNKYMVVDMMKAPLEESERAEMISFIRRILSKDGFLQIQSKAEEIIQKYAVTGYKGKYFCVDIDNAALVNIFNELMNYVGELIGEEDVVTIPDGVNFLGDGGISVKYSIFNNNISSAKTDVDLKLDISELYELDGSVWEYESDGIIECELTSEVKYTNISRTKVVFPEITAENSIDLIEELAVEPEEEYEEYEENEEYPKYWVSDYFSYIYTEGDEIYIPLRSLMVAAYDEQVQISYNNGVITLSSEYFPGFKELVITVGNETAYADGMSVHIGKTAIKDDTTYITASTIEDIFGWELVDASYNFVYDEYSYAFYTKNEQFEMY